MKPLFEKIEPGFDSSFTVRKFDSEKVNQNPLWHQHPEYEIVFISRGSRGRRHIGHHVSYYDDGDLIFLGPDLPHYGFSEETDSDHYEIVLQMRGDFLGPRFFEQPEMRAIRQLFERAKGGLAFHGKTMDEMGEKLNALLEMNNFDRLIHLLKLLNELARSDEYKMLKAGGYAVEVDPQEKERIRVIYRYVEKNFQETITLEKIAREVSMTVPAFCRYIKKLTGKTFTHFVNEFRIGHACKLLNEEGLSISEICFDSGFNNFSHFNKQFKLVTEHSPSEYRKQSRKLQFQSQ